MTKKHNAEALYGQNKKKKDKEKIHTIAKIIIFLQMEFKMVFLGTNFCLQIHKHKRKNVQIHTPYLKLHHNCIFL